MSGFSSVSGGGGSSVETLVFGVPMNSFRDPENYPAAFPDPGAPVAGVASMAISISQSPGAILYLPDVNDDTDSVWAASELILPARYVTGEDISLRVRGGLILLDGNPAEFTEQAGMSYNLFSATGALESQFNIDLAFEGAAGTITAGALWDGETDVPSELGLHWLTFPPIDGSGLAPGQRLGFELEQQIEASAAQTAGMRIVEVQFLIPCYV